MQNTTGMPNMGGSTLSSKLTARMIEELRVGEYKNADRLPSEVELASHLGVSRSVIRDVLSNLEGEGMIERGRGIGTLVHRDIVNLESRLDIKVEYNELVHLKGKRPSVDSVLLYEKPANKAIAAQLQVAEGEPLVVCEKRLLASGTPVIYSIDHLPKSFFAKTNYQDYDWGRPVFDIMEHACGFSVDTDIVNISTTLGPPDVREKLALAPDESLFFFDEVGYYKFHQPILQTFAYYTNFFEFSLLRKKY